MYKSEIAYFDSLLQSKHCVTELPLKVGLTHANFGFYIGVSHLKSMTRVQREPNHLSQSTSLPLLCTVADCLCEKKGDKFNMYVMYVYDKS